MKTEFDYVGLPWKRHGRTRDGLDCVGLAWLWLQEQRGLEGELDSINVAPPGKATELLESSKWSADLAVGDLVFFRSRKSKQICHVAIHLGGLRLLHILQGMESRIDNGLTLLHRLGLHPVASVGPRDVERLRQVLGDPKLGWGVVAYIVVMAIMMGISYATTAKYSKAMNGLYGNRDGFGQFTTQISSQIPVAHVLGRVVNAGNGVFTSVVDKTLAVTDGTAQKVSRVIVLATGPVSAIEDVRINGLDYANPFFHATFPGWKAGPAQTKAEAVDGTISAKTKVPSYTFYDGDYDITVPVDIRAHWDRNFPVYGFSGCAYLALRFIDASKYPGGLTVTARVKGRYCRQFGSSGFVVTTVASESLTGANGTKVRFKLSNWDIKEITSLTVNATAHSAMSASAQTGNVYHLNKTKGYVEFPTAPANLATITIAYTYYAREWTENPASHLVYLLTEVTHGRGLSEDKIDWVAADALATYCAADVRWQSGTQGEVTADRWTSNYIMDSFRPLSDHIQAILTACHASLFVSNGKFILKSIKDGSSVFSFTSANILAGSFRAELLDRGTQANRVKILYACGETFNAETIAIADDVVNQSEREARMGNDGVAEESYRVPAIDTVGQAERLATLMVSEEIAARWQTSFKTTVKGLALELGDVVDVTHSGHPAWSSKLFRIESLSQDESDRIEITAREYVDCYL
jgi:hypothetical protein